jgi:hypothetical protein
VERLLLRSLDGRNQVLGRPALEPVELLQALDVQPVEVRQRPHEPLVVEAVDELLPKSVDVHRAPGDEVLQRLHDLAWAVLAVRAPGPDLALRLDGRCSALRALRGRDPGAFFPGSALGHRRDDLRDDVPGPHDDHLIALADVLARDVLLVVEGGLADGHAAHDHRLQDRERHQMTGAADIHPDRVQLGDRGRGRELEGDRPAWLPPHDPQLTLRRVVVHLHHHTVDLEVQVLAALLPGMAGLHHGSEVAMQLDVAVDLESARAEPFERLEVRRQIEALARPDPVAPDRQRPRGGQLGVELPDRAGRRVAWVRKRVLARPGTLLVQAREVRQWKVDLAPHLQQRRRPLAVRGQGQRNRPDRPQVLCHVLADLSIAPSRSAGQHSVLVDQRNREPVHLRLGDVFDCGGIQATPLERVVQTLLPGAQLILVAGVAERHHRGRVTDLGEPLQRAPSHALGGRVRRP